MPTLATCESDLITVSSSACSPFADLSSLITRAIRKDPQHPDKSRIDTNRIANYQVYQQTKERHDNNEKVKLVPRVIEVVAAQNIQLEKCLDSKNASKNVIHYLLCLFETASALPTESSRNLPVLKSRCTHCLPCKPAARTSRHLLLRR